MAAPLIDSPAALLSGLVLLAMGGCALWRIWWGGAASRHRARGRIRRGAAVSWRLLVLLVGLVVMADGTRYLRVNLCVELVEGQEWCTHGPAEGQNEDDR